MILPLITQILTSSLKTITSGAAQQRCATDVPAAMTARSSNLRAMRTRTVRFGLVFGLLQTFALSYSFGDITTIGVVSEESNTYYPDDFVGYSSSAQLDVPAPKGTFTQDFNTLGEVVWTVTWQAPAGHVIEIAPPAGWENGSLYVQFQAGLSGGVSHYDTTPTLTLYGESGDSLGSYTGSSHYMMVRPTSANTVNAVCSWDLTMGNTYRASAISLTTTVPAGINDNINAAIGTFNLGGYLSAYSATPADPGQWISIVAITPSDISVKDSAKTDLTSGSSTVELLLNEGGPSLPFDFLIANNGHLDLTGVSVSISGPDAADFTLTTAPAATVQWFSEFPFTVTVTAGTLGEKNATLSITSNDADENPFSIALIARTLQATTLDSDSDGMSDAAEYQLRELGFDWQVTQLDLVSTLMDHASKAGLYSTSEVQAIHAPAPVIARDEATGKFTLTMDWKKATDLSTFLDFPVTSPEVSVNAQGDIEFEFSAPEDAAFFKVDVE